MQVCYNINTGPANRPLKNFPKGVDLCEDLCYSKSIIRNNGGHPMSTQLKSHAADVTLTRFFGGKDRGSCVQVTQPTPKNEQRSFNFFNHVQLTRAQAAALARDLLEFSQGREEEDWS